MKKKSKYKKINPPFGYFGSKNKIARQLTGNLPPHTCWLEAFCGSAAVTLAKPPSNIEIINDIDDEIINLFQQLRNNHSELCGAIRMTPYASRELEIARNGNKEISDLERARRFLVQSMMAINGVFGEHKGGFSYSHSYVRNGREARVNRWYNLPERLEEVVERLRSVRVENRDARTLIKKYVNRPTTLIYLDPPYLGERTKGYAFDEYEEEFHTSLLEIISDVKSMVFISGYESELYDSYLAEELGWEKKIIDTITKGSNGHSYSRKEVVWTNKVYNNALRENKLQIEFSEKELKQKKLNPER